jgi:TonB family protein
LQRALLDRAAAAAGAGNAADTERWLAYADGSGAARPEMTTIRRALQDTLIGARTEQMASLTRSFTASLSSNRLLQPANDNAKHHLFELIRTDASSPAVASARQGLGSAFLSEMRGALGRNDLDAAGKWLDEARSIAFTGAEFGMLEKQLADARAEASSRSDVVGANSLQRLEYVAPKFPAVTRNRGMSGWVELEFTVRPDGSTGDIVVTNSSPRRTFDSAAMAAVGQWRYKPVIRDGKAVEQRAAVRIRFAGE